MASIYRNSRTGNWECRIRRHGYPSRTATFDTKAEAQRWANEIEGDMARGRFVDSREAERTTLDEALERYGREITPRKRSATQESYMISLIRRYPMAQKSLAAIRSKDLADFIHDREQVAGPKAIRNNLLLLSHVFNIARRHWGMESLGNPVDLVTKPQSPRGRDRRLAPGEEQRLLDASIPALRPIVAFALETAMRRSEIRTLRWEHVDLERRTAHLPLTKNGDPRDVPLSSVALDILKSLPRPPDGLVFPRCDVSHQFALARDRAKIHDLHFHDLRHEATSRLFERGLGIQEVAAITGHRTWQMLARYTHPRAEQIAAKLADRPRRSGTRRGVARPQSRAPGL